MKSNWKTKELDENIINEFSNILNIDENLAAILVARGLTNINEAYKFINPKLSYLHSPFLMKGIFEAVIRIREAIAKQEKIGIFADSDLDGLSSLTVLIKLFERLGINPYYRFAVDDEQYGLRYDIIEEMRNNKIDLIITLDCGIRDVQEINYAKNLGIDVIICDHHEQGDILPPATIINPKVKSCTYPFKELAGVGVTFKLCHAILMSYLPSFNKLFILCVKDEDSSILSYIKNGILLKIKKLKESHKLNNLDEIEKDSIIILYDFNNSDYLRIFHQDIGKDNKVYDFIDLVNISLNKKITSGTGIEDLCRIFSINKSVLKKKYKIINSIFFEIEYNNASKIGTFMNSIMDLVSIGTVADIMPVSEENRIIVYHGLKSLKTTSHPGLSLLISKISSKITTKNIAWDISPILNTPGRFGKTNLIARFFLEKDKKNLYPIITELNILNEKRKSLINQLFDLFYSEIEDDKHISGKNLIFIVSEIIPEGLCGLLANRIAEATDKPVIIISLQTNNEIVKGSGRTGSNFNFFSYVEKYLYIFEKIGGHQQAFGFTINRRKIDEIKEKLGDIIPDISSNTEYNIDLVIPIEKIDYNFIENLFLFEPYGHKNEECLFLTRHALLKDFKRFGKEMNHGKYIFHNNNNVEAIGWDMAETMEKHMIQKEVDLIYKLENNMYDGFIQPRMLIVDID